MPIYTYRCGACSTEFDRLGIDGPQQLFDHTPEALVKRLLEVAVEKNLTSRVPTLEQVRPWYPEPNPVIATVK
jgi:hypothetical protein